MNSAQPLPDRHQIITSLESAEVKMASAQNLHAYFSSHDLPTTPLLSKVISVVLVHDKVTLSLHNV
jgi:hypothetical protein